MRPKRKAIPLLVKVEVLRRQRAHCAECRRPLWPSESTEYDHRPAIILRTVNAAGTDYEPAQNDPDFIEALHSDCHQERTTGRKPGAERTITTKGSDIGLKSKFARLEGRVKLRRKQKIPQRKNPWSKRKMRDAR